MELAKRLVASVIAARSTANRLVKLARRSASASKDISVPSTHDLRSIPLAQAIEMFKAEFRRRYPESEFAIDGEGYDDEDVDLDIYADGDQIELEQHAVEISHAVQAMTGFVILPFVRPAADFRAT